MKRNINVEKEIRERLIGKLLLVASNAPVGKLVVDNLTGYNSEKLSDGKLKIKVYHDDASLYTTLDTESNTMEDISFHRGRSYNNVTSGLCCEYDPESNIIVNINKETIDNTIEDISSVLDEVLNGKYKVDDSEERMRKQKSLLDTTQELVVNIYEKLYNIKSLYEDKIPDGWTVPLFSISEDPEMGSNKSFRIVNTERQIEVEWNRLLSSTFVEIDVFHVTDLFRFKLINLSYNVKDKKLSTYDVIPQYIPEIMDGINTIIYKAGLLTEDDRRYNFDSLRKRFNDIISLAIDNDLLLDHKAPNDIDTSKPYVKYIGMGPYIIKVAKGDYVLELERDNGIIQISLLYKGMIKLSSKNNSLIDNLSDIEDLEIFNELNGFIFFVLDELEKSILIIRSNNSEK